jgi:carboxyl-terminal processing protease
MKRSKLYLGLVGLVAMSFTVGLKFDRNELIHDLLIKSLNNAHFSPAVIDDQFSQRTFDLFLKRLDYGKKFFIQEDIDQISKYKTLIDDEIKEDHLEFFEDINTIYEKRQAQAEFYYKEFLSKPFDFKVDEAFQTDGKKSDFAKSEGELKEEWRKSLKYQTLVRYVEAVERQETALEKKDTSVKQMPLDSLEASARKKVLKNNEDWFKRLKKLNKKDRFANYLNVITNLYDPHTDFFPPKDKKEFDEKMSGQFEGIGASLLRKNGYITITSIIPGSASWRQGELKENDQIMKVAQGSAEAVDVTDYEVEDAIPLIKGKKGTEVRLTVKKANGEIKTIPIVRDVVEIEGTFARSSILDYNKKKIGYIYLPDFYTDFNKSGARHCAQDVAKEVEKLKKENISGLVFDLRGNGGGSLQECVQMAGLFIEKGPICQVKRRNGKIEINSDTDPSKIYDGPMVIMVNGGSASASEIFAAALQDYKRAVVIGSESTFGKGTVQQFLNLDNFVMPAFDTVKPLGSVKVTMQKFYRINGGSTQLKGVIPNIILPDVYDEIDRGEKELDYPLAWDEIPKASYAEYNDIKFDKLLAKSNARVAKNPNFDLIKQEAAELKARRDETIVSLNYTKYREKEKMEKVRLKKYDVFKNDLKGLSTSILDVDKQAMAALDTAKLNRFVKWSSNIKKDNWVLEACNVVNDMK